MRVILIEDHDLLAQTLQVALKAEDVEVVRVWGEDRVDLLAQSRVLAPGLLLLDFDLGDQIGVAFGLIEPLTTAGLTVVMLTGERNPLVLAQCLEEGAVGVMNKSVSFDELVEQIHAVLEGEALMTRHEREELLSRLRLHRAERDHELRAFNELTAREGEVLGELMQGKAADTIAEESVVSVATIRTQIRSILSKLGVNSQLAAVARAQQARWDPPQSS
ncbi:MAG: LuxR C-terminal-related transcriptional regulator [Actinobacteria bacterium]|nr:LuxR C-terminal-related transcriptional regulator [Actinomycetota bacterium]